MNSTYTGYRHGIHRFADANSSTCRKREKNNKQCEETSAERVRTPPTRFDETWCPRQSVAVGKYKKNAGQGGVFVTAKLTHFVQVHKHIARYRNDGRNVVESSQQQRTNISSFLLGRINIKLNSSVVPPCAAHFDWQSRVRDGRAPDRRQRCQPTTQQLHCPIIV